MANFGSDNQAGAHPAIFEALQAEGQSFARPYGDDDVTERVQAQISACFERECEIFLVATGTAANALILSAMAPPWGGIYCHRDAHIANDENTAPEFYSGGARQILIPGEAGKPCIEAMEAAIAGAQLHGVHNVKPAAISLTNASEAGTIYRPDEVAAYGELARRHDLGFHIDGARFANAVVSSGASPAELTWKAGVDALSFGATKNGALAAEVVVFFNQRYSAEFGYRRKRAGQLWSKHRFLAAQIDALLRDELWLRSAAHANAMAARLAQGLGQLPGVQIPWPTEANEVFPVFPPGVTESLLASGFVFYEWPVIPGMVRLVTSFQTREEEVDRFIRAAKAALKGAD